MGWLDKEGNGIRYQTIYANQFHGLKQMPPPARAGRGGDQAAPQAPGAATPRGGGRGGGQ
jgi:hypothetical protein